MKNVTEEQIEAAKRIVPFCESLGDNCEFGFVMRQLGHERGGLFRWAYAELGAVIAYIEKPFRKIYQFEDLVPHAPGMVLDTASSFAFHSGMKSERSPAGLSFINNESTRRTIYESEKSKIEYLASRFHKSLTDGGCLFVVKSNAGISDAAEESLRSALSSSPGFATSMLLVVRTSGTQGGSAVVVDEHVMNGWVSRFAPYVKADDVMLDEWISILAFAGSVMPVVRG